MRRTIYQIVEGIYLPGGLGRIVTYGIAALIVVNVAAVILASERALYDAYGPVFFWIEVISVTIFSIEYLVRLWTAPEGPEARGRGDAAARWRYAISVPALIDLIAILPFFLQLLMPGFDLRLLRALRLVRLLKLSRYSRALQVLAKVFRTQARELIASSMVMVMLLLITSTGMYLIERTDQPDAFSSIPRAMWWAMATLTTVGYGDVSPVTPLGQLFGSVSMVLGIGMFALPAGILASGFSEELKRSDFVLHWKTVARLPLFNKLDPGEIADVTTKLEPMELAAGAALMRRGEMADRMFFLLSGRLDVTDGQTVSKVDPGGFIGERALLDDSSRVFDVTALTDCRLLILMRSDFDQLLDVNPDMRDHFEAGGHG